MGETAAEIETEIGLQRERLDSDVQYLQRQLRSMVDWRVQLRRHPFGIAILAFTVACLFGASFGRSVHGLRGR